MAQDIKTSPKTSAALQAVAQSLRQVASQPAQAQAKTRHMADHFTEDAPHVAPAPRTLSHGMTTPSSPALSRAHVNAAWQPAPLGAPSTFRDSQAGQAWQMGHFLSAWQHLGPSPTPASISKARSFVAQRSKGVPAAEIEAFIYDMRIGAECHQASLVRLINLSLPQGAIAFAQSSMAQAMCVELERTLSGVHHAVRDLFVQDLRKKAHLNVLRAPTRN